MDPPPAEGYNPLMRRSSVIFRTLRVALCLVLVLSGAAGAGVAARAEAEGGWLVICGAEGAYRVPAPGGSEHPRPAAPDHADCAMCVAGCSAGCAPDIACPGPALRGVPPERDGARPLHAAGRPAAIGAEVAPPRLRGPPLVLPS